MYGQESYAQSEARGEVLPIDIADVEEARDRVYEVMERGIYPVITVPKKYAEAIKSGLVPHSTWIGMPLLAGTLEREPYMPDDEERIVLRIKVGPNRVQPRFTGPDKHYHGIVVFKGPILPEEIEVVDYGSMN